MRRRTRPGPIAPARSRRSAHPASTAARPPGAGGWTGCFAKLARAAKEERKTQLGSVTWSDAVAKARAERLGNIDPDSEKIEAEAKADEASKPADDQAAADARARLEAQEKAGATTGK